MPKLSVERSIDIEAPAAKVYAALRDFKEWPNWSPWLIAEKETQLNFAPDGRSYTWDGQIVGSGSVELLEAVEGRSLKHTLTILKPWKAVSTIYFTLSESNGRTQVAWRMDGSLPIFMFFLKGMMQALIGMDYERGLRMLKDYAETGQILSELSYTENQSFPGCNYIGIERSCAIADIGDRMSKDFETLRKWAESNTITPSAPCLSIYSKWKFAKGECTYTACMPVDQKPDNLAANFTSGSISACNAFAITHTGSYRHLGNAWSAGIMRSRSKRFRQSKKIYPFEVYETEIDSVPEAEIVTKVYFPTV